jgi:hypothetical protein
MKMEITIFFIVFLIYQSDKGLKKLICSVISGKIANSFVNYCFFIAKQHIYCNLFFD